MEELNELIALMAAIIYAGQKTKDMPIAIYQARLLWQFVLKDDKAKQRSGKQ